MTALLRRATLLATGAVLIAAEGMASVPNAANSTQPTPRVIRIGGRSVVPHTGIQSHGGPDITGVMTYTIRDGTAGGGAPIENCPVTLNFSGCDDVRLCRNSADCPAFQEPGPNPPYDEPGCVDCPASTVTGFTNASGQVTFVISGGSVGGSGTGVEVGACVTVRAGTPPNDVALDPLTAATADYDNLNGVDGIDKGIFQADLYATSYFARSDFDGSGAPVDGIDQGIWQSFLYSTFSTGSCEDPVTAGFTLCP